MPRSIASRLDKLEALAAELFKPKMVFPLSPGGKLFTRWLLLV
jgi:hypothetical protein